jgi:hypothetical protein
MRNYQPIVSAEIRALLTQLTLPAEQTGPEAYRRR